MSIEKPTVVMIHDQSLGAEDALIRNTDIAKPCTLISFIDTNPSWNPDNNGMFEKILGTADFVFVPEGLTQPPTMVAKLALCAATASDARIGLYDDDYAVTMVDLVTAQRLQSGEVA